MKKHNGTRQMLAFAVALLGALNCAMADLHVDFSQNAADVVMTISGTISGSGWEANGINYSSRASVSSDSIGGMSTNAYADVNLPGTRWKKSDSYTGGGMPDIPWSIQYITTTTAVSGNTVGFSIDLDSMWGEYLSFYAPENYDGVSQLMGTATFENATLADFGLADGTSGTLDLGNFETTNSITWGVNGAVPEPATIGLLALFGGGILFIRRTFRM